MKACYLLDSHFQATSVNDVAYGCNRGGICPWIQVCTLIDDLMIYFKAIHSRQVQSVVLLSWFSDEPAICLGCWNLSFPHDCWERFYKPPKPEYQRKQIGLVLAIRQFASQPRSFLISQMKNWSILCEMWNSFKIPRRRKSRSPVALTQLVLPYSRIHAPIAAATLRGLPIPLETI